MFDAYQLNKFDQGTNYFRFFIGFIKKQLFQMFVCMQLYANLLTTYVYQIIKNQLLQILFTQRLANLLRKDIGPSLNLLEASMLMFDAYQLNKFDQGSNQLNFFFQEIIILIICMQHYASLLNRCLGQQELAFKNHVYVAVCYSAKKGYWTKFVGLKRFNIKFPIEQLFVIFYLFFVNKYQYQNQNLVSQRIFEGYQRNFNYVGGFGVMLLVSCLFRLGGTICGSMLFSKLEGDQVLYRYVLQQLTI
eukprot:TRINITY_DN3730_c0_g1_i10.p3 TRINITY_DN3730_c0_g1~~TRINITY_DN3730_c0_g1_i10.p3  ORF type:complete len:247 (-),score=1.59 TRINITY_DN3730_c0_g1_i10:267-1007(-)